MRSAQTNHELLDNVPVETVAQVPALARCALLLDIDGTLIELAPTPDSVVVPKALPRTLAELWRLTGGALALVSGRSLADIDSVFGALRLPAIGGHGAEFRLTRSGEASIAKGVAMDTHLKKRFCAIADLSRGILLEDKGYSLAIHYRLAPDSQNAIYKAIAAIRADLPAAPIEVLTGKCVVEVKGAGFSKATAVRDLLTHAPFAGRHPVFIGDDVTDDTVFAIMPDLEGTAFSVGRKVTGLNGYFKNPANVRAWLDHLIYLNGCAEEARRKELRRKELRVS